MTTVWEQVTVNAKLISLPEVYLRLKELLAQPDYSMADVALIIGQDPALTARLLRLVNSPLFWAGHKDRDGVSSRQYARHWAGPRSRTGYIDCPFVRRYAK